MRDEIYLKAHLAAVTNSSRAQITAATRQIGIQFDTNFGDKKFSLQEGRFYSAHPGRCVYPIIVFIVHYAFRSREENLFEKCSGNWKNLFGGSFSLPLSAGRERAGSRRLLGNRCAPSASRKLPYLEFS